MTGVLAAFVAASVVLTVSPGPDTLVVLRNGAAGGRRAAAATAVGVLAAGSLLLVAVVVGLAGALRASDGVYTVLRYAGAAYLVYLGVRSLLGWWRERAVARRTAALADAGPAGRRTGGRPWRGTDPPEPADDGAHRQAPETGAEWWGWARQGFTTCILNPKLIAILVALFPQFALPGLDPAVGNAVLAGVFWLVAVSWFVLLVGAVGWLGRWLSRPAVRQAVGFVAGVVLVGMGLAVALQP